MYRIDVKTNKERKQKIQSLTKELLPYNLTFDETNTNVIAEYWNDNHAYVFENHDEVNAIEKATEELHNMSLETAKFLAEEQSKGKDSPFYLNIPDHAVEYARESLERGDLDVYGRFDLVERGGEIKMLEYNADTPTSLIESSYLQLDWLQDVFPEYDQFNRIEDMLVARWAYVKSQMDSNYPIHFGHTSTDSSYEDLMTTAYMADQAQNAGWEVIGISMEEIGYDNINNIFVDNELYDDYGNIIKNSIEIKNMFKLYPWEDMMYEPFGEYTAEMSPHWFEPAWKMFLSTKVLSAGLWHLYPNHEYLLESHVGSPQGMTNYVRKPLHGREGDKIDIYIGASPAIRSDIYTNRWGEEGYVYQDFFPLPNYQGTDGSDNHVTIGSWVVGGKSAGIGIRESNGLITDTCSRFVPHVIDNNNTIFTKYYKG